HRGDGREDRGHRGDVPHRARHGAAPPRGVAHDGHLRGAPLALAWAPGAERLHGPVRERRGVGEPGRVAPASLHGGYGPREEAILFPRPLGFAAICGVPLLGPRCSLLGAMSAEDRLRCSCDRPPPVVNITFRKMGRYTAASRGISSPTG